MAGVFRFCRTAERLRSRVDTALPVTGASIDWRVEVGKSIRARCQSQRPYRAASAHDECRVQSPR